MLIVILSVVLLVGVFSFCNKHWYKYIGVWYAIFTLAYLVPSYYIEKYGEQVSISLLITYSLFLIPFLCCYLVLSSRFEYTVRNDESGLFYIEEKRRFILFTITYIAFLAYIKMFTNDLSGLLFASVSEQRNLIDITKTSSLILYVLTFFLMLIHTSTDRIRTNDYIFFVIFIFTLNLIYSRNPALIYGFAFFSYFLLTRRIKVSFIFVVSSVFVGAFLLGAINARRAVGFDILAIISHLVEHGVLEYSFGGEFTVPSRVEFFVGNAAGMGDIIKFPGFSLFVVTFNALIPDIFWTRLPTLSRVISDMYGTTGGLPFLLEIKYNFGNKLIPFFAVIFSLLVTSLDYVFNKCRINYLAKSLLFGLILYALLNSQRIDAAVFVKMFVVGLVIYLSLLFVVCCFLKRKAI